MVPLVPVAVQDVEAMVADVPLAIVLVELAGPRPRQETCHVAFTVEELRKGIEQRVPFDEAQAFGRKGFA